MRAFTGPKPRAQAPPDSQPSAGDSMTTHRNAAKDAPRARRHHYIPVFLLKRFALDASTRTERVRVIRKERVHEAGVRDVGVERDFHMENTMGLDSESLVAFREGEMALKVNSWCSGVLEGREAQYAASLVEHLWIRSRVFRRVGKTLFDEAVAEFKAGFFAGRRESPANVSPKHLIESALDEAARLGALGVWTDTARSSLVDRVRCDAQAHLCSFVLSLAARVGREFGTHELWQRVVPMLHSTVIVSQLYRSLSKGHGTPRRWCLQKSPSPLLLGDIGPLVRERGSREFVPLMMRTPPDACIMLPLSPSLLLIGSPDGKARAPSTKRLNLATVQLSHEFVVGNMPHKEMEKLRPMLATRASEHSPEVILQIAASEARKTGAQFAQAIPVEMEKAFGSFWSQPGDKVVVDADPQTTADQKHPVPQIHVTSVNGLLNPVSAIK